MTPETCEYCGGTGERRQQAEFADGSTVADHLLTCEYCGGTGLRSDRVRAARLDDGTYVEIGSRVYCMHEGPAEIVSFDRECDSVVVRVDADGQEVDAARAQLRALKS
jgi:hypothetical protein